MEKMNLLFAQDLVADAVRTVLGPCDAPFEPVENYQATLKDLGLEHQDHLNLFAALLHHRIEQAGYEIDPDEIPHKPDDTLFKVASALPGHSTKKNNPRRKR
jgi:hypothetical protein